MIYYLRPRYLTEEERERLLKITDRLFQALWNCSDRILEHMIHQVIKQIELVMLGELPMKNLKEMDDWMSRVEGWLTRYKEGTP